jgi:hypothetical protein
MIYRVIAGLIGALLAATAGGWLLDPETAAGTLGMTYMDGIGRSTLVGDMSAFFVFLVVMCVMGAITKVGHYLHSASLLLLLAAIFRTLAWGVHGAEFATTFIVFELVCATLLFFSGTKIDERDDIV